LCLGDVRMRRSLLLTRWRLTCVDAVELQLVVHILLLDRLVDRHVDGLRRARHCVCVVCVVANGAYDVLQAAAKGGIRSKQVVSAGLWRC
jgi:hypothetical protein